MFPDPTGIQQPTSKLVAPQQQAMRTVRGHGAQGPLWQGAGHLWLPHRSLRAHTWQEETENEVSQPLSPAAVQLWSSCGPRQDEHAHVRLYQ